MIVFQYKQVGKQVTVRQLHTTMLGVVILTSPSWFLGLMWNIDIVDLSEIKKKFQPENREE